MKLRRAYRYCIILANRHNPCFRAVVRVLPRRSRRAFAAFFAFACICRNYANADSEPEARMAALATLEEALIRPTVATAVDEPIIVALHDTARRHNLALDPLRSLLEACRQDIIKSRYQNFGELMDYCRQAATPIGRLALEIQGKLSIENVGYSDALGCALQLFDIFSNLPRDYQRCDRIYAPQDELERFAISEEHLRTGLTDPAMQQFMDFQWDRILRLLRAASPLERVLRGRRGFAFRLLVLAVERLIRLKKLQQDDVHRPVRLSTVTWLMLSGRAVYQDFKRPDWLSEIS